MGNVHALQQAIRERDEARAELDTLRRYIHARLSAVPMPSGLPEVSRAFCDLRDVARGVAAPTACDARLTEAVALLRRYVNLTSHPYVDGVVQDLPAWDENIENARAFLASLKGDLP